MCIECSWCDRVQKEVRQLLHRSFTCYSSFYFVLAVLRENTGLSVGQFVQFWPVVLFFFLFLFFLISDFEVYHMNYRCYLSSLLTFYLSK